MLWNWDAGRDVPHAPRSKGSDPQKRRGLLEPAFTASSHAALLTSCLPCLLQRASLPSSLGPTHQPCSLHVPPCFPVFTWSIPSFPTSTSLLRNDFCVSSKTPRDSHRKGTPSRAILCAPGVPSPPPTRAVMMEWKYMSTCFFFPKRPSVFQGRVRC